MDEEFGSTVLDGGVASIELFLEGAVILDSPSLERFLAASECPE